MQLHVLCGQSFRVLCQPVFADAASAAAVVLRAAVCAVWPIILSFMPARALKKVFPPIVTGTTIFLIGAKLIATGFKVKFMASLSKVHSWPE